MLFTVPPIAAVKGVLSVDQIIGAHVVFNSLTFPAVHALHSAPTAVVYVLESHATHVPSERPEQEVLISPALQAAQGTQFPSNIPEHPDK